MITLLDKASNLIDPVALDPSPQYRINQFYGSNWQPGDFRPYQCTAPADPAVFCDNYTPIYSEISILEDQYRGINASIEAIQTCQAQKLVDFVRLAGFEGADP